MGYLVASSFSLRVSSCISTYKASPHFLTTRCLAPSLGFHQSMLFSVLLSFFVVSGLGVSSCGCR